MAAIPAQDLLEGLETDKMKVQDKEGVQAKLETVSLEEILEGN